MNTIERESLIRIAAQQTAPYLRHIVNPASWRPSTAVAPPDRQALADIQLRQRYPERYRSNP